MSTHIWALIWRDLLVFSWTDLSFRFVSANRTYRCLAKAAGECYFFSFLSPSDSVHMGFLWLHHIKQTAVSRSSAELLLLIIRVTGRLSWFAHSVWKLWAHFTGFQWCEVCSSHVKEEEEETSWGAAGVCQTLIMSSWAVDSVHGAESYLSNTPLPIAYLLWGADALELKHPHSPFSCYSVLSIIVFYPLLLPSHL